MSSVGKTEEKNVSAAAYEPTGAIHWFSGRFTWVGALANANSIDYALIQQAPNTYPEVISELNGPQLCRQGLNAEFFLSGTRGTVQAIHTNTGLELNELNDSGIRLQECMFSTAKTRERIAKKGFDNISVASIGERNSLQANVNKILACRPAIEDGSSEILLFDGSSEPKSATVDWPLSQDNPVIHANPHDGSWLVYPSFTFARRQVFKEQLPGIPVCRINRDFELSQDWVPWNDWNESGPYRFYNYASKLVALTSKGWTAEGENFSGVYSMKNQVWIRSFSGEVDIDSLTFSQDGMYLAWREALETEPTSIYGKLRYITRIEAP